MQTKLEISIANRPNLWLMKVFCFSSPNCGWIQTEMLIYSFGKKRNKTKICPTILAKSSRKRLTVLRRSTIHGKSGVSLHQRHLWVVSCTNTRFQEYVKLCVCKTISNSKTIPDAKICFTLDFISSNNKIWMIILRSIYNAVNNSKIPSSRYKQLKWNTQFHRRQSNLKWEPISWISGRLINRQNN